MVVSAIGGRARGSALGLVASAALVLGILTTPIGILAQETTVVPPAGTTTWDEMVRLEQLAPRTREAVREIPLLPVPGGYDLGPPRLRRMLPAPAIPQLEAPPGQPQPNGPTLTNNFAALGDNNTLVPPDTNGAAGPNHLMTMLNTEVLIQNLSGGVVSTVSLATFWTAGTGLSGTPFDPRVQYDPASSRWVAVADADINSATSAVWLAVSSSSDPTLAWTFFSIPADLLAVEFADFPGLGVNNAWIAITNNMYTIGGSPQFMGPKLWVIDKSTAISGGPLTTTTFGTGFNSNPVACVPYSTCAWWSFAVQPAHTFGSSGTLYLIDSTGFLSSGQALLRLSEITGTGPSPSWAVTPDAFGPFPGSGFFLVANNFDYFHPYAAQSGSVALIRTNEARVPTNAVFRNGHLWATHSGGQPVGGNDRVPAFWYELDPTLLQTTGNPIVQSGVIDGGSGVFHYYPSLAVNALDDVVVGFTRSDSTIFAEAAYTSRFGTDAPGTMMSVVQIKAGEDSYEKLDAASTVRWGDYSATVVDPGDDLSFWTIQEYAAFDVGPFTTDDRWGTWWGFVLVTTTTTTTTTVTTTTTTTTTSTTSTTLPPALCGPAPEPDGSCRLADVGGAGKSSLQIKDDPDNDKDSLKWKWNKGVSTGVGDFKTPTAAGATYRLCLYDASGATQPLLEADIPNGVVMALCGTKPCWTPTGTSGFKYKNKAATPEGITDVKLKAGAAGKAQVQVKGKGALLGPPGIAGLVTDVVVQLIIDDGGTTECFKTAFPGSSGAGSFTKTPTQFKAKGP